MAQRQRGAAGARPPARVGARPADGSGQRPGADLAALRIRLRALVEPLVTASELYLEDLTVSRAGRRHLVRVSVDGEQGIGHDELSAISHRLSTALDEAEQTDGDLGVESYTLEVSSPGVDRPLTLARHWRRNVGRLVTVRISERTLTARIAAASDTGVRFEPPGPATEVPLEQLGAGRVQLEFSRLAELADDDFGAEFDDDHDDDDEDHDEADQDDEDRDDGDQTDVAGPSEMEDRT